MSEPKVSCRFDPTKVFGLIGMFHCPDCGVMLLAGYPHFDDEECKFQLSEWEVPIYDAPAEGETTTAKS